MTEFIEEKEFHYCRNPRCRSKLKAPVSNRREAFCIRGCHTAFYRKRCLVCERPIEQPKRGGSRMICKRSKCYKAFHRRSDRYRYRGTGRAKTDFRNARQMGTSEPLKRDRPWFVVAGSKVSASVLHCATVPDGPNGQWEDGKYRRIEDRSRALLKAHFRAQAAKCVIRPHHPPVNILGGYQFPD